MLHLLKNTLRDPKISVEAVSWLFQRYVLARDPVRNYRGVEIGEFIDFSEYHSFPTAMNDAEYNFLKSGDFGKGAIVDIGANLGLFSLIAASHNPDRRIVAFEPGSSTFQALEANVKRNGANIECHNIALAKEDGELRFTMKENARANSSLASDDEGITVTARRLDTIVEELGIDKIGLLKVDTEGFEAIVFRGAPKVLDEMRPSTIYFEVCPDLCINAGFEPDEPAQILQEAGYDLFEFGDDGSLTSATPEMAKDRFLANWLATPKA